MVAFLMFQVRDLRKMRACMLTRGIDDLDADGSVDRYFAQRRLASVRVGSRPIRVRAAGTAGRARDARYGRPTRSGAHLVARQESVDGLGRLAVRRRRRSGTRC